MKVTTVIARKFMLGGRGSGTSRFTGWIAIVGMAVGCFVLIVSVAILNGFESRVTQKIIGFEGDVRIGNPGDGEALDDMIGILQERPEVRMILPFMDRTAIIYNSQRTPRMVSVRSFDLEKLEEFYDFELEASKTVSEYPEVYLGRALANRLNLDLDDQVVIVSPMDNPGFPSIGGRILGIVKGIFRAGVLDFDDNRVFISNLTGEKLFIRKNMIDGIDVRLIPGVNPGEFVSGLIGYLPAEARVETWATMHEDLFRAMRLERVGAMLILSLIIIVAAFNLMSTLVLVTYQKIREIGILRTLGATAPLIRAIILKQGAIIGGSGALIGSVTGLLIVFLQQSFGIFPLPEDIYMINKVPMVLYFRDIILIPGIALVMIIGASWIASKRAIKILPKETLSLEK